jgi:uncharacterized protein with HEPN domain/predicted nucleotidyltransferase
MTLDQQRLIGYFAHITEAIESINSYTENMDVIAFCNNRLVQDAVIRNFEVICAASNNIEKRFPDFVTNHPQLQLSLVQQIHNALARGYFKVDFENVWKIIQRDLPYLYLQIKDAQAAFATKTIESTKRNLTGKNIKPSEALASNRPAIRHVIESHHARNARVFGSVLRGTDTDGSDLDILIDPTSETSLLDIGAIRHELGKLLGVPVDVLTPDALPDSFRASVLAEALPV